MNTTRTLVVHVPEWSIVAAGVSSAESAVVVGANRVLAASVAAREAGVVSGLRRREAQRRCPHVQVIEHDPGRDARAFEAVAAALDAVTPRVEVTRPGTLAFATRGPSRYFGGDDSLAARVVELVTATHLGSGIEARVGVADGSFAALLAALDGAPSLVVPPGASPSFLAPRLIDHLLEVVDVPDFVDLCRRLGLRTLGAFAGLAEADVLARFGHPGVAAHRLASGLDPRPLDARRPAPDMEVVTEIDPPADRIDRAAFVAKSLADDLHSRLGGRGLACTHVLVQAETVHGEVLERCWRHEGALSAGDLADRVRWQLDGWIGGTAGTRPTSGIVRLGLVPVEVVAARGRQLGFWGGETLVDERIVRAVARVQGLVGEAGVTVPELRGGRGPGERVARVPVAAVDLTAPRPAARLASVVEPWPGQVPAPWPASVFEPPQPIEVVDATGRSVSVDGRLMVSADPARMLAETEPAAEIVAWSGPWPYDEWWWDKERHRRRARFQVVDHHGSAHLLALETGRWWREATYD